MSIGLLFGGLMAFAIRFMTRDERRSAAFATLWIGLPMLGSFLVSFKSNVYEDKYLIGSSFPAYLLLASMLQRLGRQGQRVQLLTAILMLAPPILFSLVNYYGNPVYQREDWRSAVAYVDRHAQSGDVVAFRFSGPMAPFVFYDRASLPAVGLIREPDWPQNVNRIVSELLGKYERVWLFEYLSWLYDPAGLIDVALRAQGFSPVGSYDFNGVLVRLWQIDSFQ